MSTWAEADAALRTHLQAVQVGGSDAFNAVYTSTGAPDEAQENFPQAIVTWSRKPGIQAEIGLLELWDVDVEIRVAHMSPEHGEKVIAGEHGEPGLAAIRRAVLAACRVIDGKSSPAVSRYIRYVEPGRDADSGGSTTHTLSLRFEALIDP